MSRPAGAGDGAGVRVELDALHTDARTWRAAAQDVALRRNHAAGLIVPAAPFSRWAIDAGFPQLYEQARTHIEQLLEQASGHFDAIGTTLVDAAETIRREDERGAHDLGGG